MLRSRWFALLLTFVVLAMAPSLAHADNIQIALTQTSITAAAGTTVTVMATLTNLTSGTIFLNGDSNSTSSSGILILDNPFLTNAPLSLAAGSSSGPFSLLSIVIGAGTSPGTYTGSFLILGGPTSADFTTEGTATFTVLVSPIPEPGTLMLVATGVAFAAFWRKRVVPR
jgi:hypothetical protein